MNLSHFKKLKEDEKCAVLVHPDGHRIQVAKSMLNPKMRSMLGEMPMHMAEGGMVNDPLMEPLMEMDPQSPAIPDGDRNPASISDAAIPGSDVMSMNQAPGMVMTPVVAPDPVPVPVAAPSPVAPAPVVMPMNPPIMAQRQPQSAAVPATTPGMVGGIRKGFEMEQQGLQMEAAGQQQSAQAQASAQEEEAHQLQQISDGYQRRMSELDNEIKNVTKDLNNGEIDPNHWWNSKDDASKTQTVIGLILGGIGAGLTGKENMAAEYIDKQITRDIEAQKMNLGKKQNLLSAYYHQMGNLRDAEMMARASLKDVYASKIQAAGLRTQDPIIRARALQAAGRLKVQQEQILAPLALKQSVLGGITQGKVDPAVAIRFLPEHDQKPAREELANAQLLQKKLDGALSAFDKVSEAKTASFALKNPGKAISGATSEQMNAAIVELARDASGAFNKDEVETIRNQYLPKYTDTAEDLAMKRNGIIHFIQQKANFPTLQGYGLDPKAVVRPRPNPNAHYGKK
jgi:hypothetical protein